MISTGLRRVCVTMFHASTFSHDTDTDTDTDADIHHHGIPCHVMSCQALQSVSVSSVPPCICAFPSESTFACLLFFPLFDQTPLHPSHTRYASLASAHCPLSAAHCPSIIPHSSSLMHPPSCILNDSYPCNDCRLFAAFPFTCPLNSLVFHSFLFIMYHCRLTEHDCHTVRGLDLGLGLGFGFRLALIPDESV